MDGKGLGNKSPVRGIAAPGNDGLGWAGLGPTRDSRDKNGKQGTCTLNWKYAMNKTFLGLLITLGQARLFKRDSFRSHQRAYMTKKALSMDLNAIK